MRRKLANLTRWSGEPIRINVDHIESVERYGSEEQGSLLTLTSGRQITVRQRIGVIEDWIELE